MIKINFKFIFRNIFKSPVLSGIKIFGLTIGIACGILVYLYVKHEFSYDNFHKNADRIYRVAVEGLIGNTEIHQTYTCAPLPGGLYNDFPEIEYVVRISKNQMTTRYGDKSFLEKDVLFADSTLFNVFTFPMIKGNPDKALVNPNSVVLTESTAKKYFGDEDPVNKTIILGIDMNATVTGIIKDVPKNSHVDFDYIISLNTFDYSRSDYWWNNNFQAYILLKENTDYKQIDAKFPAFVEKHLFSGDDYNDWVMKGNLWEYYLQPLTSIHLNSDLSGELKPNGNIKYVKLFIIIGIFILLIACVNYMNLTTARSSNRANEIGIKKVNGSYKKNLILQFISESTLIAVIATIFALILVKIIIPFYNNLLNVSLDFSFFNNLTLIPLLILLTLIVGVISGSYPAFYLSSLKPVRILKGGTSFGSKKSNFRNLLVVLQFTISVALIVGTIFINKQLNFIKNERLGFNKDQILVINNRWLLEKNDDLLKQELLKSSYIDKVTFSHAIPGSHHNNIGHSAEGVEGWFTLNLCYCDADYLDIMQLKMADGRFFSDEMGTDNDAIIINEAAQKLLGYEDGAIGKKISGKTVIGIVKDYHYESMHQKIRPEALYKLNNRSWRSNFISIKTTTSNVANVIKDVKKFWEENANGITLNYSFLDEDYDKLYRNEQQTSSLFLVFSILAIFIACLGLIGLSAYNIEQRLKEIGVRKVIGARNNEIVTMLNWEFSKWVVISYVIACPLAYYFIKRWFQSFAYHINIDWWVFGLGGIIALCIAILTVSWQSLSAASKNPVESLRYE